MSYASDQSLSQALRIVDKLVLEGFVSSEHAPLLIPLLAAKFEDHGRECAAAAHSAALRKNDEDRRNQNR
jgi:hypothetical protein